jgi:glycosyltransferase involved in cell wall biosynthesis
MNVVHLAASPFFGGPERQILGLAQNLPPSFRSIFLSFAERGASRPFLERCEQAGFEAIELKQNWPWLFTAAREIAGHLRRVEADVLLCNGYKPDVIGWLAARKAGIPVVAIAHGWTGATWKVRLNEMVDRWVMRRMDCVVAVSEAMAKKVRAAGVRPERLVTICNAIQTEAFDQPDPNGRAVLEGYFPHRPETIVVAVGRLSPEKGFDVFVEAAAQLAKEHPRVGFLLFGDGPLREALSQQIGRLGLQGRFVLGGFRTDLEKLLPAADLAVLSSHTEGLPVALLEALAAGLPAVVTAVGGVPEVIHDGVHGFLVPPADPSALGAKIDVLLRNPALRRTMGQAGSSRAREVFSFAGSSRRWVELLERLTGKKADPVVESEKTASRLQGSVPG